MPTLFHPDTRPNITIEYYGEGDPEPTGEIFAGTKDGLPLLLDEAVAYWIENQDKNIALGRLIAAGIQLILWEMKNDQVNLVVAANKKKRAERLCAGLAVTING